MNSVAIIGLGWLGFPLAKHLDRMGWEVTGSKRTHDGVESMRLNGINAYYLSIEPELSANPNTFNELLDVDSLVINIPPSEFFFDTQSYVQGIKNLVEEAQLVGVAHVIFISSTSVFPQKSGIYDEESLAVPDSELGKAMRSLETFLLEQDDMHCDILRLAGLVGGRRHPVKHFAGQDKLQNGGQPVNLVHRLDAILAIQTLLENYGGHRIYHLSAPKHPTKSEYYTKMAEVNHLPIPHFQTSENDIQRIIEGNKIVEELDFAYRYPDPYQMNLEIEQQYFHSD